MNLAQIAENWNGQVTKLFNWTINRLENAAHNDDLKATQTDYQLLSVKEGRRAGKFHRRERGKRAPSCSSETDLGRLGENVSRPMVTVLTRPLREANLRK